MIDTTEARKLKDALFTLMARSVSAKAERVFWAHENLGVAIDLMEGRLAPAYDDTPEITGIPDYCEEALQDAYQLLGISVPKHAVSPTVH